MARLLNRQPSIQAIKICLALLLILGLSACSTTIPVPQFATSADKQAFLAARIDEILAKQIDAAKPGVAIIVAQDGQVIYQRSKGMADINQGISIDEHTAFELASVTKPITAIAVMQLVEKQRLSLNDPVLKWLPELPPSWAEITVRHLLTHQSGIPDPISNLTAAQFLTLDGVTNKELIQRFSADGKLNFAPGLGGGYSNTNYVLLAEIIGRAGGTSYAGYLQENIFAPVGMHSSYVIGSPPRKGVERALNFGKTTKVFGATFATYGALGVLSSVADMNRLMHDLLSGKLVSFETLRAMTSPQSAWPVLASTGEFYGYGWYVQKNSPVFSLFAHTGSEDGFESIVRVNHSKGIYYIILGNGGAATLQVLNKAGSVIQWLYE